MLCEIGVLKNSARFTGKHHCAEVYFQIHFSLFLSLFYGCLSVKLAKFLREPFLKNTS